MHKLNHGIEQLQRQQRKDGEAAGRREKRLTGFKLHETGLPGNGHWWPSVSAAMPKFNSVGYMAGDDNNRRWLLQTNFSACTFSCKAAASDWWPVISNQGHRASNSCTNKLMAASAACGFWPLSLSAWATSAA